MQDHSTAYRPAVKLTAHRGWYRVQSQTNPSVFYETSANSCDCPARKPCKHQKFVRSLNVTFFVRKEATPTVTDVEQLLAHALRALADAHPQSDERAVLLRRVDELEREVAAANYSAMRQAA